MKILVNNPHGQQEVINILEGGEYFDKSRILWDERQDGPMPEITLGGMVREGDTLRFDAGIFSTYNPTPKDEYNTSILMQLDAIDKKSIRAIREGDHARIATWNEQAQALRAKLLK